MRLYHVTLIVVATLLTDIITAALVADPEQAKIASAESPLLRRNVHNDNNNNKRSMKIHGEGESDNADGDEERIFGFLWRLKYKFWLKREKNPETIYKKLGLEGLGQDAWKNKNFKRYLEFSELWRRQ